MQVRLFRRPGGLLDVHVRHPRNTRLPGSFLKLATTEQVANEVGKQAQLEEEVRAKLRAIEPGVTRV